MDDFDSLFHETDKQINGIVAQAKKHTAEAKRVVKVVQNTSSIMKDLDDAFEKKTSLTKLDMAYLFIAAGLQMARQYLLPQITTADMRPGDREGAKGTWGHFEEHSDRHHLYYNPSLDQIIANPVPFDAINGAGGALSGGGRFGHRGATLGHDPLLGLLFGTANIATSTLTTNKLQSYHITTNNKKDFFSYHADTFKVFHKTGDKLLNQGMEGRMKVGVALVKEIVHLNSDVDTKDSLPLPVITAFDPQLASALASYGFDMCNVLAVTKHAMYSNLINMLVAMVHGAFCTETDSLARDLYQVRTRKIISYSNAIASSTNLIYAAISKDITKMDIGGLIVTIATIIRNEKFIRKVKEGFIYGQFEKLVMGDDYLLLE